LFNLFGDVAHFLLVSDTLGHSRLAFLA
jgi:hypothetical protein